MKLEPLAVTAITNFLWASEVFFLAGLLFARPKTPRSAAWFWQWALFMMALSALIGGIDHGFFEIQGPSPQREVLEHGNWFLVGILTVLVWHSLARQFLDARWQTRITWLSFAQLAVYSVLLFFVDDFRLVIFNYAPVMLLLMGFHSAGLRSSRGSWDMILGVVISFIASGVQTAGIDIFSPFDRNSLYHTGVMIAAVFLYRAGLRLDGYPER